jgi:hypothetical protein
MVDRMKPEMRRLGYRRGRDGSWRVARRMGPQRELEVVIHGNGTIEGRAKVTERPLDLDDFRRFEGLRDALTPWIDRQAWLYTSPEFNIDRRFGRVVFHGGVTVEIIENVLGGVLTVQYYAKQLSGTDVVRLEVRVPPEWEVRRRQIVEILSTLYLVLAPRDDPRVRPQSCGWGRNS